MISFLKKKTTFSNNPKSTASLVHELGFNTPGGKLKAVILSMGSVEYRNEIKYVAVAKDITEIKKLEQMKRNIIANISHELRTPLNIMKGYVEIAMDEHNEEKRYTYLQKSLKALEKQNWMIQDLLEVARGEGELEELDIVKTNINGIIELACRSFNEKFDASGVDVVKNLDGDGFVRADPDKLSYALTKLIDNALKFTEKGGHIEIGTKSDTNYMVVYVRDTGAGISEEQLEHIFEKFYQVDGTSTRKFGGNGLGLAIAKNIVNLHEGRLWVESEQGEGSTFYFSIPYFESN